MLHVARWVRTGCYPRISYPNQPVADGPVGPYIARGPVGSYGMLSPCDSDQLIADAPVGQYVLEPLEHSVLGLSMHLLEHSGADRSVGPSINPVGPVDPYVTCGPVGSYGTLSPCDSDTDADQPVTDGLVGLCVACGPVGSYGMLSPCNSGGLVRDVVPG